MPRPVDDRFPFDAAPETIALASPSGSISLRRLRALVTIVACVVVTACSEQVFVCGNDVDCVDGEAQGTCERNGVCSFPDASCPGGSRYGEYGPDDVADQCVDMAAAPDNLIGNGNFDEGTTNWTGGSNATITSRDDIGKSNGTSVLGCANEGVTDWYTVAAYTRISVAAGQRFRGSAWVRRSPDGEPSPAPYLMLRFNAGASDEYKPSGPSIDLVNDEWKMLPSSEEALAPTDGELDLSIGAAIEAAPNCFLLDDVVLLRVE